MKYVTAPTNTVLIRCAEDNIKDVPATVIMAHFLYAVGKHLTTDGLHLVAK